MASNFPEFHPDLPCMLYDQFTTQHSCCGCQIIGKMSAEPRITYLRVNPRRSAVLGSVLKISTRTRPTLGSKPTSGPDTRKYLRFPRTLSSGFHQMLFVPHGYCHRYFLPDVCSHTCKVIYRVSCVLPNLAASLSSMPSCAKRYLPKRTTKDSLMTNDISPLAALPGPNWLHTFLMQSHLQRISTSAPRRRPRPRTHAGKQYRQHKPRHTCVCVCVCFSDGGATPRYNIPTASSATRIPGPPSTRAARHSPSRLSAARRRDSGAVQHVCAAVGASQYWPYR
jgi:hypothetical protein